MCTAYLLLFLYYLTTFESSRFGGMSETKKHKNAILSDLATPIIFFAKNDFFGRIEFGSFKIEQSRNENLRRFFVLSAHLKKFIISFLKHFSEIWAKRDLVFLTWVVRYSVTR